ncbi:MAG: hypothetical protein M9884_03540 [Rhodocyclaceae bacterium]|nr:hypothetical protein [Rhodocyclaceae bacterium]MCO5096533.1 hypothetical protein [Rhodocyclaceae bacterium]
MSFDYVFFNEMLRDRFVEFASGHGVASTVRKDEIEGYVVELPDGLADAMQEAIDDEYESLMDEQMLLAEADGEMVSNRVASVTVEMADGSRRSVRLPAPIARLLFERFAPEEVHGIVSAIAQSLENPIDGPLCRKADD